MPELPEVELMTRNLAGWAAARSIVGMVFTDPRLGGGALQDWWARAQGRGPKVVRAFRRAKYTVVEIDLDDHCDYLLLHYRMTGRVVAETPGRRKGERLVIAFAPASDLPDHVVFEDSRRLGTAEVLSEAAYVEWSQSPRRGPEPWPMPRAASFWKERLISARGAIKPALMDQARVAGLGNIAVSEALWRAEIDPKVRPAALSPAAWQRLAQAVPAFIEDTLAREAGPEIAYVNSGGSSVRGNPSPFDVYRCEGQPCPKCEAPIRSFRQSGRSTFWCAACQGTS